MKILVSGGAGFIGLKLVKTLVESGHDVIVIDNFSDQVHGKDSIVLEAHSYLNANTDLYACDMGDFCEHDVLSGVDYFYHLASETGTGQSMYELDRYLNVNVTQFATLLGQVLTSASNLSGVFVAGSRSIYGEGMYRHSRSGQVLSGTSVPRRLITHLQQGRFDVDPDEQNPLLPIATTELALPDPLSIYASTKISQEMIAKNLCAVHQVPVHCLRFQNVYGPGQSLKNPYTGIVSIFLNNLRNGIASNIFEDGKARRDFVYVEDLVKILTQCPDYKTSFTLNLGSGVATTVLEVFKALANAIGVDSEAQYRISGDFRVGDVRCNFADMNSFFEVFPRYKFTDLAIGVGEFTKWALGQAPEPSAYERSLTEAKERGVMYSSEQSP
jgi:dTDP-L-rhamnose 4-epimerase